MEHVFALIEMPNLVLTGSLWGICNPVIWYSCIILHLAGNVHVVIAFIRTPLRSAFSTTIIHWHATLGSSDVFIPTSQFRADIAAYNSCLAVLLHTVMISSVSYCHAATADMFKLTVVYLGRGFCLGNTLP